MSLTVQDLLNSPQLDLRLLGGWSGLANTVEWAHTCDLPDPWNWMSENQVMLTNGQAVPSDPEAQVDFITRLHGAGVAACGVGDAMGAAPFSRQALDAAERLGLPLFAIPFPLPFVAVAQTVADAASAERGQRLRTTARLYDLLGSGPQGSMLSSALMSSIADLIGFDVTLIDARCRHPWLDDLDAPSWVCSMQPIARSGGDQPVATLWRTAGGEVIHALPVRTAPECIALFRPRAGEHHDTGVLLHAASVLGTVVSQSHLDGVLRNRRVVEYVDRILNDGMHPGGPNPYWLQELGYDHATPSRGVVLTGGTAKERDDMVHRLQRHGVDLAASMRSGQLLLFVRDCEDSAGPPLIEMLEHVHADGIRIGVGSRLPASEILTSLKQAVWALELSETGGKPPAERAPVFPFTPEENWLGFQNPRQGEAFVQRVLGPLLSERASHRELLMTLETYLREERSPQRTSDALHLHRQTVNQRLRRIETLLGRELRSTEAVTELWIALRLLRAVGRGLIG